MSKKQSLGRNSAMVLSMVGTVSDNIPLPDGVILRNEDEMVIWGQFTRVRCARDWREFDLVLLAKAVRAEADIRKHQVMLDKSGPLLKTDKGTPIANPLISIIDSLQRQQLAIIRSLSLSQTESDPRTQNAQASAQSGFRRAINNMDDLIAR